MEFLEIREAWACWVKLSQAERMNFLSLYSGHTFPPDLELGRQRRILIRLLRSPKGREMYYSILATDVPWHVIIDSIKPEMAAAVDGTTGWQQFHHDFEFMGTKGSLSVWIMSDGHGGVRISDTQPIMLTQAPSTFDLG